MRSFIMLVVLSVGMMACQKENKVDQPVAQETQDTVAGKQFEMYQMSEMAMLMEQMFADNNRLRTQIMEGKELGSMPDHFQKIHSAQMTDPEENDAFFKEKASEFLDAQAKVFTEPEKAKEHFNAAVSACVACHQEKCGGPIPRIKKLYIK